MMNETVEFHNPEESWRNHQRIIFIKGFYKARHEILDMYQSFQNAQRIEHTVIDNLLELRLRELKDLSHILYRVDDESEVEATKQRMFDKVLGEIWHELGKARDNIRLLET